MTHLPFRGTHRDDGRHAAAGPRRAATGRAGRAHARVTTTVLVGAALLAVSPGGLATTGPSLPGAASFGGAVADLGGVLGEGAGAVPDPTPGAPVVAAPPPDACATPAAPAGAAAGHGSGAVGTLGLELVRLMCSPLGPAAGLPPTELEAQEPERLYALVDADHPVRPSTYVPDDLVPLQGGPYEAREEVAQHLGQLLDAAAEAGHTRLSVQSGFRDRDTQAGSYADWVRRVGPERAERVSAPAGHSEHQLGLAVDVTGPCGFSCSGSTPEEEWVAGNAHRFGFLVRYPEGGEDVTGYVYEPWHLRYVGPRAAWGMHLQGEVYWERFAQVALEAAEAAGA